MEWLTELRQEADRLDRVRLEELDGRALRTHLRELETLERRVFETDVAMLDPAGRRTRSVVGRLIGRRLEKVRAAQAERRRRRPTEK